MDREEKIEEAKRDIRLHSSTLDNPKALRGSMHERAVKQSLADAKDRLSTLEREND